MKIIIEGAGEVGSHLAKMLGGAGEITVIDCDEERLVKVSSMADVITVCGRTSSIKAFNQAGISEADLFVGVNPGTSQQTNIVSAILAKKLGCKKVCARIDSEEYTSYENKYIFTDMGVDMLFYPEKIAAAEIASQLKRTVASDSMDFARGKLQLLVFKLEDDSPVIDMKISEFAAAVSFGNLFRVITISRNESTIIPGPGTKFRYHDLVYIITTREGVGPVTAFLGKASIEIRNVMILGASAIGELTANSICDHCDNVKIIDPDMDKCLTLRESTAENVVVVNGDGRNSDFLLEEKIREYDAFVAATPNDEANILSCVVAKRFGVLRTIAEVENIEYMHVAEEMGVDAVINKKLMTAAKIFKMTLSNKVRFVKYMSGTDAEILEYIVAKDSLITKHPLKEIDFPKNAIVGGIIRGNDSFIAIGDTQIEAYDRVEVFALPDAVKEIDRLFR